MGRRKLNRSAISKMANVSRASVTKWFNDSTLEWVNVETKTVIQLATSLGISPAYFLTPTENLEKYKSTYLWDSLYPDMSHFLCALKDKEERAIARVVQTWGFRRSIALLGKRVIDPFERYAHFIHPIRRKELEVVWPLYR